MTRTSRFFIALACASVGVSAIQIISRAAVVPSRYLFVWAGDWDRHDSDFLAVLDIKPAPGRYGSVITTVPVGETGLMPHHTEHELGSTGTLFANGFAANRTFLFNVKDPLAPQIVQRFGEVNGLSFVHSFARLPNGHVLATFQGHGPENRVPGGIAEFDDAGEVVRSASAADPHAHQQETMRPYSLAVVPALDRIVVGLTAMGIPTWSAMHDMSEHLDHAGDQIQVWRLSDLTVVKTVELPRSEDGAAERAPSEPRVLADGKTVVVMTMGCGLYRVTGLEGSEPSAELVYHPGMAGCGVPVVVGNFWMMPVSGGHRVLSIDMSNLGRVHDVSTLQLNNRQTPHWLSSDGSRMVVINGAGSAEHRIWMANVDGTTGALTLDEAFRAEGASEAGFDFNQPSWPHGPTGDASPHGTVFVR